ncbi:MAG: AEC family transporter [Clostridiales Family XIII bacterium]|jgi:predicted permease|nr:AEC family transporter [Clostridiales Family XIII bacterium]
MWSGLESVGVILIIIAIGFFFTYKHVWPERTADGLSAIVVKLSAPCLAVTSITARFDRELLASSLLLLLLAALHLLAMFLIGKGAARALRLSGGRRAVFEVSFTFSNVIFIGLPINQIVFGEEGVPFLFAYYILSLATFWGFGAAKIAAAGSDPERAAPSLRKVFNPGFLGVLLGAGLVQAGLSLPPVLDTGLGYLAALTVPLSLLVIGANLTVFAGGVPRVAADEVMVMAGKFVISPLVMLALMRLLGVTGLPFRVFLLSSTMPCHMQTSIIAQHHGVEGAYASKLVGLSTLLSFITIPLAVALIHAI